MKLSKLLSFKLENGPKNHEMMSYWQHIIRVCGNLADLSLHKNLEILSLPNTQRQNWVVPAAH
jgi:hypothetical protein